MDDNQSTLEPFGHSFQHDGRMIGSFADRDDLERVRLGQPIWHRHRTIREEDGMVTGRSTATVKSFLQLPNL